MAADIWLISDTHFSHKNIIKFTDKDGVHIRLRPVFNTKDNFHDIMGVTGGVFNPDAMRPFNDIHEHNQYLTEKWNNVVKPQDHVWHGGDFGDFRCKRHLNGVINLIVGNHDEDFQHYVNGETTQEMIEYENPKGYPKKKISSKLHHGFKKIRAWRYWDVAGIKFIQTHFPIYMGEDGVRKYQFNVHGHTHGNRIDVGPKRDMRYYNISVECLDDYTPIHIEEVAKILKKR